MISKKRIHGSLMSIVRMLREGQTEFSVDSASLLANRIEKAANDHYPIFYPRGYFFLKFKGELIKCKFIRMASHIPWKKTNDIYYINANLIGDIFNKR